MPEIFTSITAVAAPLIRANIDTDAIIPSREIKSTSRVGLADGLFAGWRYRAIGGRDPDPQFILNEAAYQHAKILLGGANFGCGSSREHAVWALMEFGLRAVIAPGFAPIFFGNCVRNGLLPVRLDEQVIAELAALVVSDPAANLVTIDLESQTVRAGAGLEWRFEIDSESRSMLLAGMDAIDLTLRQAAAITTFLSRDRGERPWIYPQP